LTTNLGDTEKNTIFDKARECRPKFYIGDYFLSTLMTVELQKKSTKNEVRSENRKENNEHNAAARKTIVIVGVCLAARAW